MATRRWPNSTLALALLGLLAFYGLLRAVGVGPAAAGLGVALLALNPLFLHFSDSFMTDVPFLALALAACYGYVRGLQGRGAAWLWAAGCCAGGAFLIRQFAVLVPLGFLGYLALDAWRTRRVRPAAWLGVAVVPALVVAGWWLWSQSMLPSGASVWAEGRRGTFLWQPVWVEIVAVRVLAGLPLLALSAWAAVRLRRRRWWLVAVWTAVVAWGWVAVDGLRPPVLAATEPPFTFVLGPIGFAMPQQIDTFVDYGNLLRVTGFDFFEYHQAGLWPPAVWQAIFAGATVLGILLAAAISSAFLDWLRAWRRGEPAPLAGVYLAGFGIFGASLALPADFFDRYVLGFLPFAILFVMRGARGWGRWAWRYSVAAAVVWGLGAVLLQADYLDHDTARWQAADWLAARVQPVQAGFEWGNTRGYGNGNYEVADYVLPGFRVEAAFPYTSRLSGFAPRSVYAEVRAGLPPLPGPAAAP